MRQKLFGDVSKTLINSIDASGFLQLHGKVKSVLLKVYCLIYEYGNATDL